ncbi:MAG: hypothetical protein V3U87_04410 [Methylococcaceae bacterium]
MQFNILRKLSKISPRLSKFAWHKFSPADFNIFDKLYRGFKKSDLDQDTGNLEVNSIRFPDFSCNWSRFSKPQDVKLRSNGSPSDGCYSFTVEHSRYKEMATPCHDPLKKEKNYSHIELRQLTIEEQVSFEPPKGRKLEKQKQGWSKAQRLEYRQNLVFYLIREIEPTN